MRKIKNKNFLKSVLMILLLILLSIPFIQQEMRFAYVIPLKGDVVLASKPNFTISTWFNSNYQNSAEKYVNDNFGFRPEFVRLKNQIDYWLFNSVNAKGVVIGKEDYLYEWSYIEDYIGRNFIGKEKADSLIYKYMVVRDLLNSMGKNIVFLFASGKASYFPEYFPDSVDVSKKTISNYQYFANAMDSADFEFIDFNRLFVNMRDTTKYPLYTKGGIHWTKYGESIVTDSIISYTENLLNVQLPHFNIEGIDLSYLPRYRDNDIGEALNLILPHSFQALAYPITSINKGTSDKKVRAIFLADSYFWEMYNEDLTQEVFNNGQFWYYGKEIYSREPGWNFLKVTDVDIKYEVEKSDIIFIMQTEATINWFSFGFIDILYDKLTDSTYIYDIDKIKEYEVNLIKNKIKLSDDWLKAIENKAINKGISIDSMIILDAEYVFHQSKNKGLK